MCLLSVKKLTKRFLKTLALDNVSFDVTDNSIIGLLGPNGAGKTTLLRIINGILAADSGRVIVDGMPASLLSSRHIGYMPEERGLYDKMRVDEQILYFGRLKGGQPQRLIEVMNEYAKLFNLKDQLGCKVRELSKGNQQKVQIIATIVHEPKLVILDEPFSGFDPINGAILQELVKKLHDNGATIMLSSHNMASIEEMCKDIVLLDNGRILLSGDLSDIKERHKSGEFMLTTKEPLELGNILNEVSVESIMPDFNFKMHNGYGYKVLKCKHISNNQLISDILAHGEILRFEELLPSLNDIFMYYTR